MQYSSYVFILLLIQIQGEAKQSVEKALEMHQSCLNNAVHWLNKAGN